MDDGYPLPPLPNPEAPSAGAEPGTSVAERPDPMEALADLLRRQAHEAIGVMVQGLQGHERSGTRTLGLIESYCAAQRVVLADIEELPRPRRKQRRGGPHLVGPHLVDLADGMDDDVGFNAGPPGGLNGMLSEFMDTAKEAMVQQAKANAPSKASEIAKIAGALKDLDGLSGVETIRARLQAALDVATLGGPPLLAEAASQPHGLSGLDGPQAASRFMSETTVEVGTLNPTDGPSAPSRGVADPQDLEMAT